MKKFIFLLLPSFALAGPIGPTAFPVFLKAGFSSVLEFEDPPTRVVLGDGQSFQVEKLDHSLVIKTLATYASTNMFVYFKIKEPRLFVLTASEDAEPTYYKKIETIQFPKPAANTPILGPFKRGVRLLSAQLDAKKDYLTTTIEITADSNESIKPDWKQVRMVLNKSKSVPAKLWAERQEVERDSQVKARFIFARPDVPRDLKNVKLVIPLVEGNRAFTVSLKRGAK